MQIARTPFRLVIVVALVVAWFVTAAPSPGGATITVTSTADGDLPTLATNDTCDLREAIEAANTNTAVDECTPGSAEPGAVDTIAFNIGSAGTFQSIILTSSLLVNAPLLIDGSTQGLLAGGAPSIQLTGSPETLLQFQYGSDGSTVKSLQFYSTAPDTEHTIYQNLTFAGSGNHHVLGSYFNTNGTSSLGSGQLNLVLSASSGNWVGGPEDADRNIFGGATGVSAWGITNTTIQNNYFGVGPDGDTALTGFSSSGNCIWLNVSFDSTTLNTIRDNLITGCADGILLDARSAVPPATITHTLIAGNHIGTNHDGTATLPVSYGILLLGSADNVIGGTTAEDRNVIAGTTGAAIQINYAASTGNVIKGNYLGTSGDGTASLNGLAGFGIMLTGGSNTTVGGSEPGSGNLISGFGTAVYTAPAVTGTQVLGNYIGTNASATAAIPNYTGLYLASDDMLGDWFTPGNNVIAGNTTGVWVVNGAAVPIYGNKIGIDPTGTIDLPNSNGIVLESGATARVVRNWINHNTGYGAWFQSDAALAYNTTGAANCFTGNGTAVKNDNASAADFRGSWWGSATGPTGGDPGGTGDAIDGLVTYSPYTVVPAAACGPDARLSDGGATLVGVMPDPQLVGTSSRIYKVPFINEGFSAVTIYSISIPLPFEIMPSSTCPVAGGPVNPGVVCYIDVRFSPTAIGDTGFPDLVVTSDAASSPNEAFFHSQGVAGKQVLKNSSFETDSNRDNKPDLWTLGRFNAATDKRDCTVHKTGAGACSLKLVGNGQLKTATQTISQAGHAGDDFKFSLWSRAQGVPPGATYRVTVQLFNGSTLVTAQTVNFAPASHGFLQAKGVIASPGPYTRVVFKLTFKSASGAAWFDAAALTWAP